MPRKDSIHDVVKNTLTKAGWTITADPLTIIYKDVKAQADLEAQFLIEAEQAGRRIVVEIKTFSSPSPIHDLQEALGQYSLYRTLLNLTQSDSELYLAVHERAYEEVLSREGVQDVLRAMAIAIIVIRLETEEILQWIN